jgi:hypothetical protein
MMAPMMTANTSMSSVDATPTRKAMGTSNASECSPGTATRGGPQPSEEEPPEVPGSTLQGRHSSQGGHSLTKVELSDDPGTAV